MTPVRSPRSQAPRSAGSSVRVYVDDGPVQAQLRQARREANRNVRTGIKAAVEASALPRARSIAPGFVRENVAAGAQGGRGYLTFKGRGALRKAAALLNFGGTRRDVIRPKKAQALKTPEGPRGAVTGPRRYKGKRFLERGAEEGLPKFTAIVMREVMQAFDGLDHN